MEVTRKQNILVMWFSWHLAQTPRFLFSVWGNYLAFGLHFFSVPILFATFFSPWRKYQWAYPKGFHLGGFFSTLVTNFFSRVIGAMARTLLILFGVLAEIFIFITGIITIILWILMPFIMVFLLIR